MSEQRIALSKYELPWVTWELICVKFSFDPFITKSILIYTNNVVATTN